MPRLMLRLVVRAKFFGADVPAFVEKVKRDIYRFIGQIGSRKRISRPAFGWDAVRPRDATDGIAMDNVGPFEDYNRHVVHMKPVNTRRKAFLGGFGSRRASSND